MRFIGDVHLGRKFRTGVPLDRRGELEELFFKEFDRVLRKPMQKKLVQLGDLFDSPVVDNEVLWRAYEIISVCAELNPETDYYFIAGNHDLSKDLSDVPAIKILQTLLEGVKNVHFVLEKPVKVEDFTLIPWSYVNPLEDLLKCVETPYVAGHFEEPLHPALVNSGLEGFSGHIHKLHDNGKIHFVGSILPIAFGEESEDSIMKTVDLKTLLEAPADYWHNKRVRVMLKEGEELPANVDCLQLVAKRNDTDAQEVLDVSLEDFDFKELFMKELSASGKAEELWEKYERLQNA